jgi:hypothetical protein
MAGQPAGLLMFADIERELLVGSANAMKLGTESGTRPIGYMIGKPSIDTPVTCPVSNVNVVMHDPVELTVPVKE